MADINPENLGVDIMHTSLNKVFGIFGFKDFDHLSKLVSEKGRVLDVGSGNGDLESVFKTKRPDVEFVSVNPGLKETKIRQMDGLNKNRATAALNPKLPFGSGTFELVIDSFSSLYYSLALSPDKRAEMINELVRVTADGGKVFTGPIFDSIAVEKIDKSRIEDIQIIKVKGENPENGKVVEYKSLKINVLK